ncbi:MFS transporter [Burkholderia ubonensis]|uniref:MFS transporter n=1 Tax=Burkholderia ubonensis TaxID=101571 RepID=A0AB73FVG3_9BURK|nr:MULTISPECIES: MFS transporter [Burkholderia cepacia complex]KVK87574.1 MFS transporter [Burkholderia ubonensis]KVL66103.1 MFS transporter [Burkholderia ubonensis]KVM19841.1 MFS transporter [Burkholderia ubonensis]KVM26722.1 MFS transporter [Burkholderia ubonensis]KWK60965.1 MFS transporter [Burkholderia stagnalis]
MAHDAVPTTPEHRERERLLRMLAAATFIIFFQAYMVAPIIPALSKTFGASVQTVGLVVPAYLIPYGIATLLYGLLADRLGVQRVMFASLAAFAALTVLTATAASIGQIALWRVLTGLGASGVVPLALVLVGKLFPYEQRGRPLGWLFGAMAGGMAFGSPLGAMLVPFIGWRGPFLIVGAAGGIVLLLFLPYRRMIATAMQPVGGTLGELFRGYISLLGTPRGQRTYAYVFINSMFHSGVFTWLGVYLERRYGLGPVGIGLALLGYGVPGFLFGPLIGRMADRWGRARLLPIGLALSTLGAAVLLGDFPLIFAPGVAMVLSLGYDMTQPLFAGIVTSLGGKRPGQAMGLNVFTLFVGFGLGSLIFGEVLRFGFAAALGTFAVVETAAALCSLRLFRSEVPGGIPAPRAGR